MTDKKIQFDRRFLLKYSGLAISAMCLSGCDAVFKGIGGAMEGLGGAGGYSDWSNHTYSDWNNWNNISYSDWSNNSSNPYGCCSAPGTPHGTIPQ